MTYTTEVIRKAASTAGINQSDVNYLISLLQPTAEILKYRPLNLEAFFNDFCKEMGVSAADLLKVSRKRCYVDLRATFSVIALELFNGMTYSKIGELLQRDRLTIYHYIQTKDQKERVKLYEHVKKQMGIND